MEFIVEVINTQKQKKEIEVEAEDRKSAISNVRSQGYLIIGMVEKPEKQYESEVLGLSADLKHTEQLLKKSQPQEKLLQRKLCSYCGTWNEIGIEKCLSCSDNLKNIEPQNFNANDVSKPLKSTTELPKVTIKTKSLILFNIYKHPIGEIQVVKQGWCWPAFFFNYLWAFFAKMWGLGVKLIIAFLIFSFIFALSNEGVNILIINTISIFISIIVGVNGNVWRERNLITRGFDLIDTVVAENKDGAVANFIKTQKNKNIDRGK